MSDTKQIETTNYYIDHDIASCDYERRLLTQEHIFTDGCSVERVVAAGSFEAMHAARRLLSMAAMLVCLVLASNASADAPKQAPKPVCEKPVNGVTMCRVGTQQYQCTTTPDGKVTSCFLIGGK